MVKIIKRNTKHGLMVVLEKGNMYKAIVDPNTVEEIQSLRNNEHLTFTDEQGLTWTVTKDDKILFFANSRYSYYFKIKRDAI